ncbi:MAG: glycosyltransferase family 4 protein [Nocardioidaceae bacterium]|nr:glycosyltransferase family 4 protein [Nocardioidaceae bacterium]
MRILQLHNRQGSGGATGGHGREVGALEVMAHEAHMLAAAGHDIEQFTLPAAEDMGLGSARLGLKAVWNAEAYRQVSERVKRFGPDVVHVHTPFPVMSPAVFQAANRLDVATVTTVHGYRYSCIAGTCFRNGGLCQDCIGKRLKWPGLWHRCYHDSVAASGALTLSLALHRRTLHREVDRFIALTSFSKHLLVRDGIPAHKIVVKPNSVPDPGTDIEEVTSKNRYVAFVGRLTAIKGIRTLLAAWKHVPQGSLELHIAGDGPLRPMVEQHCRDDASISYLGWLDESGVYDLMAKAECVVVPSEWYEGGLPLVLLRSFAVGTPVIVSNLENLADGVVHGHTGLSFDTGDVLSLAHALSQVAHEPASFRRMRLNAREAYLQHYSPDVNLARIESIYTQVLIDRASGRPER